jgi:lipid-binding SYLF domain-containing protein
VHRLIQIALVLIGFAGAVSGPATAAAITDDATKRAMFDADVHLALVNLAMDVRGSQFVLNGAGATAALVFPEIGEGSFIASGARGYGALVVPGQTIAYYRIDGLAPGPQVAGPETHSMVIVFRTPEALQRFQNNSGWNMGDASMDIVRASADGEVDVSQATRPVLVFVFTNRGLMEGFPLEGTRITKYNF